MMSVRARLSMNVRASEATVTKEIEGAGFALLEADHDFRDSYALRFRRVER